MYNKECVISVDPGLQGAVCIKRKDSIKLVKTPIVKLSKKNEFDITEMVNLLQGNGDDVYFYIEKVSARPGEGVVSSWKFGKGYGIWLGIAHTLKFKITEVTPQAWKKKMLAGTDKSKGAAILRAKQLFPNINLKATERSRKDDDNLAEAFLIGEYGWRVLNGNV